MKNKILLLASVFISLISFGQNSSDILENGIRVKSNNRIFLELEDSTLKYYVATTLVPPTNFIKLPDSTYFLADDNEIHIFMVPFNPLNINFNYEISLRTDPIDSISLASISMIFDMFENKIKPVVDGYTDPFIDSIYNVIGENVIKTKERLKDNQKNKITSNFKNLKNISFIKETKTINELESVNLNIQEIETYFNSTDSILKIIETNLIIYKGSSSNFVNKYVISNIYIDLKTINSEQRKRIKNLKKAYNLVHDNQKISSLGGDRLPWLIEIDPYKWNKGKLSFHKINIITESAKLSDKDEIIDYKPKTLSSNTFIVRKFNLFVPEISIGSAYTFFKYNSYGTTSDSTGQMFVASGTENLVNNINISTMLNFNMFIKRSNLHPLYQIGFGLNSGIPTLFTGLGIRTNINGIKRFAISGGLAMTWLPELDELNVGDKISGTDDIDKDLTFQFSWPPKAYIGIQYNF